jgi:hypothetical protein
MFIYVYIRGTITGGLTIGITIGSTITSTSSGTYGGTTVTSGLPSLDLHNNHGCDLHCHGCATIFGILLI